MTEAAARLSFKEKVGYSLGDMAANFIFQTMMALQLSFYTDTFGLTAAQAGTLFLVVGLGAAVINPIMGMIADRTNTRWGKFRPWLLWTAVPFGIIGVLTFTTPNLSPGGKIFYAYTTYILLRLIYVINNVPYAALTGVITGDPDERTSLSSFRQFFANSAAFIVQSLGDSDGVVLRARRQGKRLSDDHGFVLGPLRHLLHHHVCHHKRAHPARPATEDLSNARPRRPLQEPIRGSLCSW